MPLGVSTFGQIVTPDELNAGWVTREDAALKLRLQGIRVPVAVDDRGPDSGGPQDADRDDGPVIPGKTRSVPVYYRLPENEVRRRTFPYITIDFLGAVRDVEREHRGFSTYGVTEGEYRPPGTPAGGGIVELPVPMTMTYQVTQWARYARHDRVIMTTLLTSRLEPRFGYLEMTSSDDAVDDLRVARMDLLSGPTPGDTRDEEGKRLFRKMYTVGISSELFQSDMAGLVGAGRLVIEANEIG